MTPPLNAAAVLSSGRLTLYAEHLGKVKTGSTLDIRSLDDLELDVFSEMVERANALCPPNPGRMPLWPIVAPPLGR